ncbi:ribosomal protein S18-alanine N-acetyltransferase [Shewanella sp. TC10]|uniref:ribosomal protein S18-alanine N-acetyltransferase n=1 Tax=Shewanella sp. TC10 TaxID=1419739 RepID=UPI00129E1FE1|nr:ribosomal protein S18-alanine N-acetyltransferase [Shewanella sp. TC10]
MSETSSFSNSIVIKPLSPENVAEMSSVENQAHSHPMSLSNLEDCFGRLYRVFGAYEGEQLIGFAIVQQIVDELTLLDICIKPQSQGKGLGLHLLNHIISDAKQHEAVIVMLEVRQSNKAAIGLYQKLGFVESGRRTGYYPAESGREDAILMDYRL